MVKKKKLQYPGQKTIVVIAVVLTASFSFAILQINHNDTTAGIEGDAFNGLTAPIISLISAGLIFYSFMAQIEANKKQTRSNILLQRQWEFDTYYKMYNEIDYKFTNLTVISYSTGRGGQITGERPYKSIGWINHMIEVIPNADPEEEDGMLNEMGFILNDINQYMKFVKASKIPQKEYFLDRINDYYAHNMEEFLEKLYQVVVNSPRHGMFKGAYVRTFENMEWLRSRGEYSESHELE